MTFTIAPPQAIWELGGRENQEDNIFPAMGNATSKNRLFIVCDGMGGHDNGEVASALACKVLSERLATIIDSGCSLSDYELLAAVDAIYDEMNAATPPNCERPMGTTMTLVALHEGGLTAAHIGDSRIYHIRPKTRQVLFRSKDHSLVQQLYDEGEITLQEMKTSPQRNIITKALMPTHPTPAYPYPSKRYIPDIYHSTDLMAGDWLMLCSDGILEELEDEQLVELLADATTTDKQKREKLVDMTFHNRDNHSAYLIRLEKVRKEASANQKNDESRTGLRKKMYLCIRKKIKPKS